MTTVRRWPAGGTGDWPLNRLELVAEQAGQPGLLEAGRLLIISRMTIPARPPREEREGERDNEGPAGRRRISLFTVGRPGCPPRGQKSGDGTIFAGRT